MQTARHPRPAGRAADVEALTQTLSQTMILWARRAHEPRELIDRKLDDLYRAWVKAHMALADAVDAAAGIGSAKPSRPTPAAPPPARRRSRSNAGRTNAARRRKAVNDGRRERFIVTRYADALRKAGSPKAARELVADGIRRGLHLPPSMRATGTRRGKASGYSEKSVARVLKRFELP